MYQQMKDSCPDSNRQIKNKMKLPSRNQNYSKGQLHTLVPKRESPVNDILHNVLSAQIPLASLDEKGTRVTTNDTLYEFSKSDPDCSSTTTSESDIECLATLFKSMINRLPRIELAGELLIPIESVFEVLFPHCENKKCPHIIPTLLDQTVNFTWNNESSNDQMQVPINRFQEKFSEQGYFIDKSSILISAESLTGNIQSICRTLNDKHAALDHTFPPKDNASVVTENNTSSIIFEDVTFFSIVKNNEKKSYLPIIEVMEAFPCDKWADACEAFTAEQNRVSQQGTNCVSGLRLRVSSAAEARDLVRCKSRHSKLMLSDKNWKYLTSNILLVEWDSLLPHLKLLTATSAVQSSNRDINNNQKQKENISSNSMYNHVDKKSNIRGLKKLQQMVLQGGMSPDKHHNVGSARSSSKSLKCSKDDASVANKSFQNFLGLENKAEKNTTGKWSTKEYRSVVPANDFDHTKSMPHSLGDKVDDNTDKEKGDSIETSCTFPFPRFLPDKTNLNNRSESTGIINLSCGFVKNDGPEPVATFMSKRTHTHRDNIFDILSVPEKDKTQVSCDSQEGAPKEILVKNSTDNTDSCKVKENVVSISTNLKSSNEPEIKNILHNLTSLQKNQPKDFTDIETSKLCSYSDISKSMPSKHLNPKKYFLAKYLQEIGSCNSKTNQGRCTSASTAASSFYKVDAHPKKMFLSLYDNENTVPDGDQLYEHYKPPYDYSVLEAKYIRTGRLPPPIEQCDDEASDEGSDDFPNDTAQSPESIGVAGHVILSNNNCPVGPWKSSIEVVELEDDPSLHLFSCPPENPIDKVSPTHNMSKKVPKVKAESSESFDGQVSPKTLDRKADSIGQQERTTEDVIFNESVIEQQQKILEVFEKKMAQTKNDTPAADLQPYFQMAEFDNQHQSDDINGYVAECNIDNIQAEEIVDTCTDSQDQLDDNVRYCPRAGADGKGECGIAYIGDIVIPYVLRNGFKYVMVKDAIKFFPKCSRRCYIWRNAVLSSPKLLATMSTHEEVFVIEELWCIKNYRISTGDPMIRLDRFLLHLQDIREQIKQLHFNTKKKYSILCNYSF